MDVIAKKVVIYGPQAVGKTIIGDILRANGYEVYESNKKQDVEKYDKDTLIIGMRRGEKR